MLPHLAVRLFGILLAIHRSKLDIILSMLGTYIGLTDLAASVSYTFATCASEPSSGKVVVIPIHDMLMCRTPDLGAESGLASYTGIAAQLDAALTNPEATMILLDISSLDGESGGVLDLADHIRVASQVKPVWVVADDMALSAACALASVVTHVFVARAGGVGSISVIAMHVDRSVKDAKDGVRYTVVLTGEYKNDLNPHEPLSDAAHTVFKAEVNRAYELLVEMVARHRGLDADIVHATEAGLFLGPDIVATGLADVVGSLSGVLAQPTQSLSPLPTQVAPVSQAGFLRSHQTESSMNDRISPAAPDRPLADPVGSPPQPSTASTAAALSVADAVEITQTYTLARRIDLIADSLDAWLSPARVRSQPPVARVEVSPETTNRTAPDTACPVTSSPLIDATKQIATQSIKKEIRDARSRRTSEPKRPA